MQGEEKGVVLDVVLDGVLDWEWGRLLLVVVAHAKNLKNPLLVLV